MARTRTLALAAALTSLAGTTLAQPMADQPLSITIYSSAQPGAISPDLYRPRLGQQYYGNQEIPGYAVVREDRAITLNPGKTTLKITDVAALIEPTTVQFRSMTDPTNTRVGEQNFQFDLVSNDKLLEKFIDKEVAVDVTRGNQSATIRGTLLSMSGGLTLRKADGSLEVVNGYNSLQLPTLPEGLITRPTLVWDIYSQIGGAQTARISYQTSGITWWTDYNLVFSEGHHANAGTVDVSAWVSILNKSGGSYEDARLKLIAGDVQRVQPQFGTPQSSYMERAALRSEAAPEFSEKAFFEYHLYTLSSPATIPDNTTKQLELFPTARSVPAEKVLVYAGQANAWWGGEPMMDQGFGVESKRDVDVYLRFKNEEAKGLGIPMPAGRIRVSQLDAADGNLEFIGEDTIKHTPKDEQVLIRLGKSFDVVGSRTQLDFNLDSVRRTMTETIEIEIRNRKDEPVDVIAQERMLRWTNWEFVGRDTPKHEKLDARTVHIPLSLNAGETKKIRYTVRYTW
jgi:hypothetical protein